MAKLLYQAKVHHVGREFVEEILSALEQQAWPEVSSITLARSINLINRHLPVQAGRVRLDNAKVVEGQR